MSNLVNLEQATEEVNSWLDHKKIGQKKRESQKDQIDSLIDAICEGVLTLDAEKNFVQTLKFPTEGEMPLKELKYAPRVKTGTFHLHLQGVKASDTDARICAYIAAITSKPKALIQKLDTEDYGVAQSIAIFFL